MKALLALLIVLPAWAVLPAPDTPLAPNDPRYCGEPARNENGRIKRSSAVRAEFQRVWPCPSTVPPTGPCTGWERDHILPLACGGCDSVANYQWLPVAIKSCAGPVCKDRWERKAYCRPQTRVVLP